MFRKKESCWVSPGSVRLESALGLGGGAGPEPGTTGPLPPVGAGVGAEAARGREGGCAGDSRTGCGSCDGWAPCDWTAGASDVEVWEVGCWPDVGCWVPDVVPGVEVEPEPSTGGVTAGVCPLVATCPDSATVVAHASAWLAMLAVAAVASPTASKPKMSLLTRRPVTRQQLAPSRSMCHGRSPADTIVVCDLTGICPSLAVVSITHKSQGAAAKHNPEARARALSERPVTR